MSSSLSSGSSGYNSSLFPGARLCIHSQQDFRCHVKGLPGKWQVQTVTNSLYVGRFSRTEKYLPKPALCCLSCPARTHLQSQWLIKKFLPSSGIDSKGVTFQEWLIMGKTGGKMQGEVKMSELIDIKETFTFMWSTCQLIDNLCDLVVAYYRFFHHLYVRSKKNPII